MTAYSINPFECHSLDSTAEDAWNTEAGESGRYSAVRGVCVFCVNSYCKWDLKNWHSHLSSTLHLSQTNEGPEPQSEIDISFWTSQGIFWIWREVRQSQGDSKAAYFSAWKSRLCTSFLSINIHPMSWQLKCWQAPHNGRARNPTVCPIWNWSWN